MNNYKSIGKHPQKDLRHHSERITIHPREIKIMNIFRIHKTNKICCVTGILVKFRENL